MPTPKKEKKEEQLWSILEEGNFVIIIPNFDSKPHGFPKKNKNKAYLAGIDCPCKPTMEILNDGRILYTHNSFIDIERVEKSLRSLIK